MDCTSVWGVSVARVGAAADLCDREPDGVNEKGRNDDARKARRLAEGLDEDEPHQQRAHAH
jgi:hypothetical protein